MIRFYRYIIYKLYSWSLRRPNDTPVANVIFTLSFVHSVQIFMFYMVILKFFPVINIFHINQKIYLFILGLVLIGVNYLIFYNKERWEAYLEEFRGESKEESCKGKIFVLSYLIGSILLFFLTTIILYGVFG